MEQVTQQIQDFMILYAEDGLLRNPPANHYLIGDETVTSEPRVRLYDIQILPEWRNLRNLAAKSGLLLTISDDSQHLPFGEAIKTRVLPRFLMTFSRMQP